MTEGVLRNRRDRLIPDTHGTAPRFAADHFADVPERMRE
jgi:hypothetical protein